MEGYSGIGGPMHFRGHDERFEAICHGTIGLGEKVPIAVLGEARRGVSRPPCDLKGICPCGDPQCDGRMP